MARVDHFSGITPHCCICGNIVPADRPKQAITCSKECSDLRKNWRRSKQDARECRYCRRPASLAERSRYQRWRRWEEKNPPSDAELSPEELAEREYRKANPPKKRGPKPRPEPVIVSHTYPKTSPFDTIEDEIEADETAPND